MHLTGPGRARRAARAAIALLLTAASAALTAHSAQAATSATHEVAYHGYHLRVPADWPVIDLATEPGTCVRFDVHAVYLGHPAAQEHCPTHVVGRTEALLIEPLDGTGTATVDRDTVVAAKGTATYTPRRTTAAETGQIRLAVPSAGVIATATYGTGKPSAERILRTGRLDGQARAGAGRLPEATASAATLDVAAQPGTYAGKGFDACAAPSTSTMNAWGASPYRAVGVYIGGNSRACAQPNLTSSWVSTVTANGWHLIPTYVGSQAPCSSFGHRVSTDPATARSQGTAEADDAVAQAQTIGLPAGSVLYDDMEGYDNTNSSCSTGVLNYLSAWTDELHARGYLSGVYSSAGSGMRDLAAQYTTGAYSMPDHIWFAWWNNAADTNSGTYVPAADWPDHQRIHQYFGGTNETWGGVTVNIDGDYLDVSDGGSVPPPPPAKYWVDTFATAPVYGSPTSTTQTGTLNAGTNYVYCKVWGRQIGDATTYNHWWLKTDPDTGPANQYVSAYYLSRWGNDEAKDNNGTVIPDC
ncbi:hypothetical protein GCM10014715_82630 [Streptomyces spiralis]|uniref:Rv2525c-like glycoside hydrolase-like domain-containing protein n=1 Tax=Streptomyces spiralis TaxID=66376 RepID=A0A919E357_9ACTN|nr:DUF1906 domain-containing protein [Streptomyces spiralis]GHF14714.1 hypothetical protein GCM10014715_82630 [Streptomyces spiralis]